MVYILMDIVMTFVGSTSNDAEFHAWVTDVTVPKQRPIVETVLSVIGTISSSAVTGVGSFALIPLYFLIKKGLDTKNQWC